MNEDGFLARLAEQPDDVVTRQVYADWLEDQGDVLAAARAAYLRLEVQLVPLTPDLPTAGPLLSELDRLRDTIPADWVARVALGWDVVWVRPTESPYKISAIKCLRTVREETGLAQGKSLVEGRSVCFELAVPYWKARAYRQKFDAEMTGPFELATPLTASTRPVYMILSLGYVQQARGAALGCLHKARTVTRKQAKELYDLEPGTDQPGLTRAEADVAVGHYKKGYPGMALRRLDIAPGQGR